MSTNCIPDTNLLDVSFAKCLSSENIFTFSDTVQIQGQLLQKNVSDGKELTENINYRNETESASVKDPLNMHRTGSNDAKLVSEIPNVFREMSLSQ